MVSEDSRESENVRFESNHRDLLQVSHVRYEERGAQVDEVT